MTNSASRFSVRGRVAVAVVLLSVGVTLGPSTARSEEIVRSTPQPFASVNILHAERDSGKRFVSHEGNFLIYSGADNQTYRRDLRSGLEISVGTGQLVLASPDGQRILLRNDSSWTLWASGSANTLPEFAGIYNVFAGNSQMTSFIVVAGNPGPAFPATTSLHFCDTVSGTSANLSQLSGQGVGFYEPIYVRNDGTKAYFSLLSNRDGIFEYDRASGVVVFLPMGRGCCDNGHQLPTSASTYGQMQIAFDFPNRGDRFLLDMESFKRTPVDRQFDPNGSSNIFWASPSGFAAAQTAICEFRTGFADSGSWTAYRSTTDCIGPSLGNESIWVTYAGEIRLYRIPLPLSPLVDRRVRVGTANTVYVVQLTTANYQNGGSGWTAVFSCAAGYAGTSSVNNTTSVVASNLAIVVTDSNGDVCVRSSAATDIIVDVAGTLTGASIQNPTRILDTRS